MVAFEGDRDDDCENVGVSSALEHFSEVEEVLAMIDDLKNIYNTPQLEAQYQKLNTIFKQYYEQPHLLDPHLDVILAKFIDIIKNKDEPMELKHAVFNYMYQLVRVRGYKVMVRHLPHEVSDLIMVLTYLEAQSPKDANTWCTRFVLLLWLSIVVIIPFHMSRLDGIAPDPSNADSDKKITVMERILNICKIYAMSKDTCAEASAFLTSKFLIRSDVKELYMGPFFDWACELNSNLKEEGTIHFGVLASVAAVLKHGKRDDLLPYAPKLLEWVTRQDFKQHKAILVRKYGAKIVQRIGLLFLRPRVTAWRYTRGSRSLSSTLAGGIAVGDDTISAPLPDEDYEDIPQEVEEVVELLLVGLRDEDSVVRWSCAKGVGRIGARLPAAAAADVAAGALANAAADQRDAACHGACLAAAELARRGLLSDEQVGEAALAVASAMRRDEPRAGGGGGGGAAARDAACYAAWAFARAYPAATLRPHAATLAAALLTTACFDREINCRRAASAAFQENVGRHGQFPYGIDVLTAADYHSVGPRNNAFLVVAPKIAVYREYSKPLIDHLVELKIEHWDCAIRELAAKALFKLTDKLPEYVAESVLPCLLKKMDSIDLNMRHGSVMAIGEVYHALAETQLENGKKGDSLITPEVIKDVRDLVPKLRARNQFRGLGGELMRQACCQYMASLSMAHAPYHSHEVIEDWLTLIEECLTHDVQAIREKAITALPLVIKEYLSDDGPAKDRRKILVHAYCEQLSSAAVNGHVLRMGYSRAVGCLPKFVLKEHLPLVISSLIECTKVTDATFKWAESRRDAVIGLTEVCQTVGVIDGVESVVGQITSALMECLAEYTADMRGDIGAWVREASMSGLLSICRQCAAERPQLNSPQVIEKVMSGIAQQAVEKIDRTRAHAGRVFTSFIYNEPKIDNIPEYEALKRIFPQDEVEIKPTAIKEEGDTLVSESSNVVLWLFPGHTMPKFIQLLSYPVYRYSMIKGLVVSGGELTESLVKHTTQALFAYLNSLHNDKESLAAICDTIIQVFADNIRVKRMMAPIFNFLDRLMSSGAISPILDDPKSEFAANVLKYLQIELTGCKNVYKHLDSINVLCQLIQVGGDVSSRSLVRLAMYLCHSDKYVRRCAAARLYEALTLYGDVLDSPNLDQAMGILENTNWESDVAELRPIRNDMCDLLGIKRPVLKQKNAV